MFHLHTEYGPIAINYDPSRYKKPAAAAKALHKALRKVCRDMGMNPDIELFIQTPEESARAGCGRNWRVVWESGPYEWGTRTSPNNYPHWYTEPYYSFDLCFTH